MPGGGIGQSIHELVKSMYNVAALRAALGFILPALLFFSKAEGKGKARIGKEREEKRGRRKRSVAKGSREGSDEGGEKSNESR